MKLNFNKTRMYFLGGVMIVLAALFIVNFTEVCNLQAITINGEPIENWETKTGFISGKSLFDQPTEMIVDSLLQQPETYKVELSYSLPGSIDILTNQFEPICFVLDQETGKLRGLNANGRIVQIRHNEQTWDHPVLTNLRAEKLYDFCSDSRVRDLVPQLIRLRSKQQNLYSLIEEINFNSDIYLEVLLSGINYQLRVRSDAFYAQMNEFISFVENYHPKLDEAGYLDLTYGTVIVVSGGNK